MTPKALLNVTKVTLFDAQYIKLFQDDRNVHHSQQKTELGVLSLDLSRRQDTERASYYDLWRDGIDRAEAASGGETKKTGWKE